MTNSTMDYWKLDKMSELFVPGIHPYEEFDVIKNHPAIQSLWYLSIPLAAVYLVSVYASERLVKRKHNTKWAMALWNFGLALFSIIGTMQVTWPLIQDLQTLGFERTVCMEKYYMNRKQLAFWIYTFCWSKIPELFDTAFIVLRKAPLQILHTYHHASVMVFCFWCLSHHPPASYWYVAMNFLIHSIMYTYFGLRAINVQVPQVLAKCITSLQSLQMFVGYMVNFYSIYRKLNGYDCGNSYFHSFVAILLYFSYFVLFLRFASQRYRKSKTQ